MNAQHIIPDSISEEIHKALAYYPELQETSIEFRFKENIKKSTMQARPTFDSFFRSRKNRSYVVLISETFKIADKKFLTTNIPSDVLVGWIGHELGHIIDYTNRSKLNLLWFGVKYVMSDNHIVEAERAADTYAVQHNMEDYILKTKDFILNNAEIHEAYKLRIKKYYLSPEEIMDIIDKRNTAAKETEAIVQ
ncbi:hypothetical protein LX77_00510 [Gelidibacter algens]|uniref:Uncharacterized protein n=1 Tax=Gelidibacter algens TaxID=49280 RepID=A0A1A7R4C5_9FLAO|nr:hypothetical protein [Gelidibacter algens]OBX27105.1 hypothetical protein A9996_01640 [Gelidibacter algens]RAJ27936.1 hypothetical protein LX77_00510 [Gelidibacter algens]